MQNVNVNPMSTLLIFKHKIYLGRAIPGGGALENICTGMLKVDFRMLTISIPVYWKKKKKKHPITIPNLYD